MSNGQVYSVSWEKKTEHVSTCDELLQLLDRLENEFSGDRAVLVIIENAKTGDSLKVGVGRQQTVLDFVPGSLEPPYYASVGNPSESGSLTFRLDGEWTEIPARNAVPRDLGRVAVRQFCESGELSKVISWEID